MPNASQNHTNALAANPFGPLRPYGYIRLRIKAIRLISKIYLFKISVLSALLLGVLTNQSQALNKPKWEFGIGAASGQLPHYPGSNHYYRATTPIPYFVYRFDNAEVGESSRFYLIYGDVLALQFALQLEPPVQSDNLDQDEPADADNPKAILGRLTNYTRRGMSNIPFTIYPGVELSIYLTDELRIGLPYTSGSAFGGGFHYVGNRFTPSVSYDFFGRESENSLEIYTSWVEGDKHYNNYFYRIPSNKVLDGRPEFSAEAGQTSVTYGFNFKFNFTDQFFMAGGYAVTDLSESIVRDSPLVISNLNPVYGLIIVYSFSQSSQRVSYRK